MKNNEKVLDKNKFYDIIITAVNIKRFTPWRLRMAKDLHFTMLLDVYGALLTEKQRETLDFYYNDDLSLGEISEETGITRQGVMNCIKKCEQRLLELEEQLGLVKRFTELKEDIDKLEFIVSDICISDEKSRRNIKKLISDIKSKL